MPRRRLILRSFQSPGDGVMLTGAVRDLHLAHPGEFETDVRTSCDALWLNNPYLTRVREGDTGVQQIEMHYPLIHESNQRPFHFIHGYSQYLEQQVGVKIPVTQFCGDIHLSAEEKHAPVPGADAGVGEHFWIIVAGGKYDFTAKWWNPACYQALVDHFRDKIQFVQCGEAGHWHPALDGVINLVGKTDTRSFIRLMHHADGVVSPVTFAMHLAAAVETKRGSPRHRPCVVIAGGREPPHWEAYPQHQFLSTVGALPCCADGGCWKSRCQPVGDGDQKDHHDLCVDPVQITPKLRIPRCMTLITPHQVIERIELYYRGGIMQFGTNGMPTAAPPHQEGQQAAPATPHASKGPPIVAEKAGANVPVSPAFQNPIPPSTPPMIVLITFRHGLGDAVQLSIVLKHLKKYRPDWIVDVAALVGKHTACQGLCRRVYILERESPPCCEYAQRFNLDWDECHTAYADSPSTKAERCLREVFKVTPDPELCTYTIHRSEEALSLARWYLEQICQVTPGPNGRYPVVLIHYEGNTSGDRKNLPTAMIRGLCEDILAEHHVPVILDWDGRSPIADGVRIHNPDAHAQLWKGTGTGDAESLAALTELSSLMIGVDSGPLHVAGATSTPTIGVWTEHHPLNYFAHADNVTHLVPRAHGRFLRGDQSTGEAYFNAHYRCLVYDDLEIGLRAAVRAKLSGPAGGLIYTRNFWVRTDIAEQDLVVVSDIAEHDSYRIAEMPMPHPVVVDVGAHIGCFTKCLHARNPLARIFAVECCPENMPALHKNVGGVATIIQGALTYEADVALLNAVYPNCASTGGSTLISRVDLEHRVTDSVALPTGSPLGVALSPHHLEERTPAAILQPGDESQNRNAPRVQGAWQRPAQSNGARAQTAQAARGASVGAGPQNDKARIHVGEYWADFRPMRTLTLEDLMQEHGFESIDILKLDCEGSEFSILWKTRSLDRIGLIVGEYHGREKFDRLVAKRFADWHLRILGDGELGTFWLTNPAFDSRHAVTALPTPFRREAQAGATLPTGEWTNHPAGPPLPSVMGNGHPVSSGEIRHPNPHSPDAPPSDGSTSHLLLSPDEFCSQLSARLHESDRQHLDWRLPHYRRLFIFALELTPGRICQIGVRAGYGAFALLTANPQATLLGIEADGQEQLTHGRADPADLRQHAQRLLEPFNFQMLVAELPALKRLPRVDLVYLDGDRAYHGCLSALRLIAPCTDRILVDDYKNIPNVRQACETFLNENPDFRRRLDDTPSGFLLLQRAVP